MARKIDRALKKGERVVYRNKKGRIVKARSDINLISEVWRGNKKTRYTFNEIENGKIKFKKFTSFQRATQKHYREATQRTKSEGPTFTIRSTQRIKDQIPDRVISSIRSRIRSRGEVLFGLKVHATKEGTRFTEDLYFDDDRTPSDLIRSEIAVMIVNQTRKFSWRFSAKQHIKYGGKHKKRKLIRKAEVTILYKEI